MLYWKPLQSRIPNSMLSYRPSWTKLSEVSYDPADIHDPSLPQIAAEVLELGETLLMPSSTPPFAFAGR